MTGWVVARLEGTAGRCAPRRGGCQRRTCVRRCGGGSRDMQGLRDEVRGACMVQGVVGGGGGLHAARQRGVSVPQILGAGAGESNGVSTSYRRRGWRGCNGSDSGSGLRVRAGGQRRPHCPATVRNEVEKRKRKRKTYLGVKWVGRRRASVREWWARGGR